jgi:hypothetical protein
MSKKIKQDYEEQKRLAAESNAINQIETFHAESMTMEAHKSVTTRRIKSCARVCPFSVGQVLGEIDHGQSIQKLGNDQIKIHCRTIQTRRL